MDKQFPLADPDDALPEIESNDVVLVADGAASDERTRRAVEEITRRLEAELADTRGELGARIAELEGEIEALREMGDARLGEIDALQAQLASRQEARPAEHHASPALVTMLHAELSAVQTERERLAAELDEVRADRERIQDELAAQIADLAGELASARGRHVPERGDAALAARVEELEAENGFLQAEIDRLAAQVSAARRG